MGTASSSQHWDGSKMPSQQGKIAIVTGANSGIGYVTARKLAERGAYVILACRSEFRGRAAEQEMTAYLTKLQEHKEGHVTGSVEFMQVDMSNLASVRAFAHELRRRPRFTHVDLLINNAGVSMPPQVLTDDQIEIHFGVNHLGHFLLTALLFDLLRAAPAARIINVSSLVPSLKLDTLANGSNGGPERYSRSKLAVVLFTHELARRLDAAKITNVLLVAAHPGIPYSPIIPKQIETVSPRVLRRFLNWMLKSVLQSSEMGALPTLYAATVENVPSSDYYGPNGRGARSGFPVKEEPSAATRNEEEAAQLWMLSEELTCEKFVV